MTKKVYILSDNGHDYTDARRFGELVKLDIPSHIKHKPNILYAELKKGLEDAEEGDYIVVSHLASHVAVATAIMVEWYGKINLLIYHKEAYEGHTVVVSED
jgi:hypothetical protein